MIAINTSTNVNKPAESAPKPATETKPQQAATTPPATPPPPPTTNRDQYVAQGAVPDPGLSQPPAAPATTLLSEDIHDGQANCLDRVGDWLELASPEIRARSEVLILRDTRPGEEGLTGHVVIRQGQGIYDPMTNTSYPDFETFNAQGNYQIAGTVGGAAMSRILSTEPGSAARQEAIARAGVSTEIATMLVADDPDVRVTTENGVRLREFAETDPVDGRIITEMPKDTRLTVLGSRIDSEGREWLHVSAQIPGMDQPQEGWVAGWYTTPATPATAGTSATTGDVPAEPQSDVRITSASNVRLRDDNGDIQTEMPKGTRLTLLEPEPVTRDDNTQWYHVSVQLPGETEPRQGWVAAQYTQPAGGEVTVGENGLPSMDSIAERTPRYRQGDSTWGSNALYNDQAANEDGSYNDTIKALGCAVTSAAMAMSNTLLAYGYPAVNPGDVDTYLDGAGGYTDQSALRWSYERSAGAVPLDHHSAKYNQQDIDNALAQGSAVVLEVRVDKTETDPGWMHYVCIVGKSVDEAGNVTYQAYDPAYNDGSGNAALVNFTVQPDGTLHATNGGSGTYDTTSETGIHWYTPTADMVAAATPQQQ